MKIVSFLLMAILTTLLCGCEQQKASKNIQAEHETQSNIPSESIDESNAANLDVATEAKSSTRIPEYLFLSTVAKNESTKQSINVDLDTVAEALLSAQAPDYLLISLGTKKEPIPKASPLPGLVLLTRETGLLKEIGSGALSDALSSLIRIGDVGGEKTANVAFSYFSEAHSMMTVDVDYDRVVDLADWQDAEGRRWVLFNRNAKAVDQECAKIAMSGEHFNLSKCLPDNLPQRTGVGIATGFFDREKPMRCSGKPGIIGDPPAVEKDEDYAWLTTMAKDARAWAAALTKEAQHYREVGSKDKADTADRAAAALRDYADALDLVANEGANMDSAEWVYAYDQINARHDAVMSTQRDYEEMNSQTVYDRRRRSLHKPAPDTDSAPAAIEDPRCAQVKTDKERGTLFMNRDFCKGDDPLTCLARQEDSTRDLIGCRVEPGADGGKELVCKQNENPLDVKPGDPGYSPLDVVVRRPVAQNERLYTDYISSTPLAGVIALRCQAAQGGICGGNP
jgi:hypothetical protein